MSRFYFDIHVDGELVVNDDEGLELADIEAVQAEAIRSLCDASKDVIQSKQIKNFAIEVRDEGGCAYLKVRLTFEISRFN